MDLLSDLNSAQRQAVTYSKGPLIIIAGAGTGKTTVIARRIAYLIQNKKAKPSEILALTFTDKAAGEMEERVDQLVDYGFVDTWIATFHAFGDKILRLHPLEIGFSPNFKVLSRAEQAIFLRESWFHFKLNHLRPLANPLKYIPPIITHISRLKDEDISVEKYRQHARDLLKEAGDIEEKKLAEKYNEMTDLYDAYQRLLEERDTVDFGDQIILTLRLFRQHPKILKKYQEQFKYILVDEFQDTNFAQNELLKLLADGKSNLTVVGDDDQSIYKFRGAAIANILEFKKTFPAAKTIVLTQNFRSYQAILDPAYKLIKNNDPNRLEAREKLNKKLIGKPGGKKIVQKHFISGDDEASFIAQVIQKKIEAGKNLGDFGILVRTNDQAQVLIDNFDFYGLTHNFTGASNFYQKPEIQLILNFIKSLTDTEDTLSLFQFLTSEIYNLEPEELIELLGFAKHHQIPLWRIIKNPNYFKLPPIPKVTQQKIEKARDDIVRFRSHANKLSAGQLIYLFLEKTGFLKKKNDLAEKKVEEKIALKNIADFFNQLQKFGRSTLRFSIFDFEQNIQLLKEVGEDSPSSQIEMELDAITISTIHLSKGLEWPIVFLTNLAQDRFPARRRGETLPLPEKLIREPIINRDFHLEEERRLFYVGMTRAREELYLTSAESYESNPRPKKISQFVIEALENIQKTPESLGIPYFEKISLFEKKPKVIKIISTFKTRGLSREQIDDYLACPKKFEYKHIINLPTIVTWQLGYGQALHTAIASFLKARSENKPFGPNDIKKIYERNWSSLNFVHKEQEEKKKLLGQQALLDFYKKESKSSRQIISVEEKFEVDIIEKLKIRGRFDAVLKEKEKIKIIDFKSSEVEDEKQAFEKLKKNRQLKIYSLAYQALGRGLPEAGLYFIEKGLEASCQFSAEELEQTRQEIVLVKEGIEKSNFKAKPSYTECRICPFKTICPFSKAR